MDAAESIRQWIKATAAEAGLTPAAWAKKAGVSPSTVQRAVKDDYAFVTSSRTLAKLANAIGVAPPAIALPNEDEARNELTYLPIRYEVGAGVWRTVDDVHEFYGTGPVLADHAYAGFDQWLERVVTDSMDREYPIGTLLHVVDAIGIGYAARTGDHVIIERAQSGGLRERSVKEVVVKRSGIELWPRSHNPKWSGPVAFEDGRDKDHCDVAIVALVLGSYRSRRSG